MLTLTLPWTKISRRILDRGTFSLMNWLFQLITLELSSSIEAGDGKKTGFVGGLSVCAFAVVGGLGLVWHRLWKKRSSRGKEDGGSEKDDA